MHQRGFAWVPWRRRWMRRQHCRIAAARPLTSVTDMFPVVHGSRYHPMHRAAFGPIWGSGCPDGECGCGRSSGAAREEFNCQLDRLAEADIPITAYLFDGSAW